MPSVPVALAGDSAFEAAPAATAFADEVDPNEYIGVVKSYNERRGFGFVGSAETALRYGRDVYIPKAEVQLIKEGQLRAPQVGKKADKQSAKVAKGLASLAPALEEEDFMKFHVKLSDGGFPQAYRIQRLR